MRLHDTSSGNPRPYWTIASNGKISYYGFSMIKVMIMKIEKSVDVREMEA
jgi:hypothetical protein